MIYIKESSIKSDSWIGGILRIFKVNPITDSLTLLKDYENVTTTAYKNRVLTHILSLASPPDIVPVSISVGTGTNPANASDTALQTLFLSKILNNIPKITGNNIIYEIRLESSEANTLITEVGVFTLATN